MGVGLHACAGRIYDPARRSQCSEIVAVATEHLSSPRGRVGFRYLDEMSSALMVPGGFEAPSKKACWRHS
jgi:hypothetical protein